MIKRSFPPDLIYNFCDYVKGKNIDIYFGNYLRTRKWHITANRPKVDITSRNRNSLKCLKEYLKKEGIESYLYLPTGRLVIAGFENFRRLSEKYGLEWWDEVKVFRKNAKRLGRGELQRVLLNSLTSRWMSILEIIRSQGWEYTPTNYGRLHVTAEKLTKRGKVEKKKEGGRVYYRLISNITN